MSRPRTDRDLCATRVDAACKPRVPRLTFAVAPRTSCAAAQQVRRPVQFVASIRGRMVMRRSMLLRAATLVLACVHTFPATKHIAAFWRFPSLSEGWEGFGALFAIGLYLLPLRVQARGLRALWRRRAVLS